MNPIGMVFTLIASVFIVALPRRLAPIPLLLGALYITRDQILMVGPAHFTVVQILITVGMVRALVRGEFFASRMNSMDGFLMLWALWMFGSSAFHTSGTWVFRAGILWTSLGSYFLFRAFIRNDEDIKHVYKVLCVLLVPVAILMILEKFAGKNYIAELGGVSLSPEFREGRFRAQGAFAHAILAGTVGAGCIPMALYFWKSNRKLSLLGFLGAGGVLFAATSSGPIMMLIFSIFGLLLWKTRAYLRTLRWLALVAVIILDMIMKAPVYFLMARIDISGGSTGYYRAQLIRSALEHLHEWWTVGTDYTRHWMATGQHANDQHADITNHFLAMGVSGGLLLICLFVTVLVVAFNMVGKALRENENKSVEHCYLIWTLGATLFGYVWVFFSISLFDQSVVFFFLILACISAVQATKLVAAVETKQPAMGIRQSRYVTAGGNNSKESSGSGKQTRFGESVVE
ncbi:MAG: hypothetical protein M0R47_06500 [Methylobacter sp.]|jgi:hypothetical protein|uniref:hypothetical protein n=1 Tax=Methylobacter sp. TaxID=2051955 RepID=UPI0025CD8913|nr:hypothetical protein [Methylobacter sp.]MCK9620172.1 hypothetical protein [Methylobacter sp.]